MSKKLMDNLIVKILVDYGAEEYVWHSPFMRLEDLIKCWNNIESIDILNYDPNKLINGGKLLSISLNSEIDLDSYYSIENSPRIMMDNDYSSYLYYCGEKYRHKGYKYYSK